MPLLILGPSRTNSWHSGHVRRLWRRGLCLRTSSVDTHRGMLCTVLKHMLVGATRSSRCLGTRSRPVSVRSLSCMRPVPVRAMQPGRPRPRAPRQREQPVPVRSMERERPVSVRVLPRTHRHGANLHISARAAAHSARESCACCNTQVACLSFDRFYYSFARFFSAQATKASILACFLRFLAAPANRCAACCSSAAFFRCNTSAPSSFHALWIACAVAHAA